MLGLFATAVVGVYAFKRNHKQVEHTHAGYHRLYVLLYFIYHSLCHRKCVSYDPGMAVIVAPDLARCRELFVLNSNISTDDYVNEFDASIANGTFYESVDAAEGIISYVYGSAWRDTCRLSPAL